jgi:hypothetical protein
VEFSVATVKALEATPATALPGTVGADVPQINFNSDRVQGIDINVTYHQKFGQVGLKLAGNVSATRGQRRTILQGRFGNAYENWKNNQANRYKTSGGGQLTRASLPLTIRSTTMALTQAVVTTVWCPAIITTRTGTKTV